MTFSILIPTRSRPKQFKSLIVSILEKTACLSGIEIVATVDCDDPFLDEYKKIDIEELAQKQTDEQVKIDSLEFCLLIRQRTTCFPDYYNRMAQKSSGHVLWVLNDDCLLETFGWDEVVASKGPDPLTVPWYGDVNDTTRNFNNNGQYSCFPMLSRAAFNALGYFFNPKIEAWGTDKFLKYVFEKAGAPVINFLDIMVNHVHEREDDTHRVLIDRLKSFAGQESTVNYTQDINNLKQGLAK